MHNVILQGAIVAPSQHTLETIVMADKHVIVEATEKKSAVVIWLHGLGDTGHGWSEVAPQMRMPWTKFIFPTAATRPVTLNMGMPMPAWFDLKSLDSDSEALVDKDGIEAGCALLEKFVAAEIADGVASERILIGGFSQGGALALQFGLTHKNALGGIFALSTWLPLRSAFPGKLSAANAKIPVFQAHGEQDQVVKFQFGKMSCEALRGLGLNVDFKTYQMQHASHPNEIRDLAAFMHERLPQDGSVPARPASAAAAAVVVPDDVSTLSVKDLKALIAANGADASGCVEKSDLIACANKALGR